MILTHHILPDFTPTDYDYWILMIFHNLSFENQQEPSYLSDVDGF